MASVRRRLSKKQRLSYDSESISGTDVLPHGCPLPQQMHSETEQRRTALATQGLCSIPSTLDGDHLQEVQEAASQTIHTILELINQLLDADEDMGTQEFREVVCRDGNRLDIRYKMDEDPIKHLASQGPWMSVVHLVLGAQAKLLFSGIVVALGAVDGDVCHQAWHRDGDHLFDDTESPCHCLNVFVPLVDIHVSNGPTEFILGTHCKRDRPPEEASTVVACTCAAGTAIIFDYRIYHRGSANQTEDPRPCLYFTYSKPWFVDHANHRSEKSIFSDAAAVADR
mmetsp:Transcript_147413/g.260667  ORF Transcript_147413/g.260667 Transcript_147413/m.260667 type:complete len:283 (-) Transcript_147413:8-856(-)